MKTNAATNTTVNTITNTTSTSSTDTSTISEDSLTLPSCLSLIHTCRNVLAEMETKSSQTSSSTISETRTYLAQLEAVCLMRDCTATH